MVIGANQVPSKIEFIHVTNIANKMAKKIKAKCLLVSLPNLETDPDFPAKMVSLANELERVMSSTIGEPVEVVLWNTEVKFVTVQQITDLIHGLKKVQKKLAKE